jgi:lincosamide nucleotidyltransferase A/C/D/E
VTGEQVLALLDEFAAYGLRVWVAGGWAVDAMAGRQTRPHGDLDLAIDAEQQDELLALLDRLDYVTTVDWLPVRAELTAPDRRRVDLHPVAFRPDGSGVQSGLDGVTFAYPADGFTTGSIGGRPVPCLSVAQQLRFREGYPLREVDHHDIALLREAAPRR